MANIAGPETTKFVNWTVHHDPEHLKSYGITLKTKADFPEPTGSFHIWFSKEAMQLFQRLENRTLWQRIKDTIVCHLFKRYRRNKSEWFKEEIRTEPEAWRKAMDLLNEPLTGEDIRPQSGSFPHIVVEQKEKE